jgi:hypothetical protein
MKWQWLCAIVGTVLLACCVSAAPVAQDGGLAKVQFLENRFDDHTEVIASQSGVKLKLTGVYAIDKDAAFLFGALKPSEDGIDLSVILRSEDGGRSWLQVLSANLGQSIYHVAFVDHGVGWAIAMNDVEDLSAYDLYRSFDYGKTWSEPIEFGEWNFRPWGIKFTDKNNGQITFDKFTSSPSDRFGIISTTDGGVTWNETLSVFLFPDDPERLDELKKQYVAPPGGDFGSYWKDWDSDWNTEINIYRAKGQDGSEWQFYYYEPANEYIVLSRPDSKSAWHVASTIYNQFTYDKGHVSQP